MASSGSLVPFTMGSVWTVRAFQESAYLRVRVTLHNPTSCRAPRHVRQRTRRHPKARLARRCPTLEPPRTPPWPFLRRNSPCVVARSCLSRPPKLPTTFSKPVNEATPLSRNVITYMRLPVPDRSPWKDFLTCARVSFGPSSGSSNDSSSQLMILNVAFVSIFFSWMGMGGARLPHYPMFRSLWHLLECTLCCSGCPAWMSAWQDAQTTILRRHWPLSYRLAPPRHRVTLDLSKDPTTT